MLNLKIGKPIALIRGNDKIDLIKLADQKSIKDSKFSKQDLIEAIKDKRISNDPFDLVDEDSLLKEFGGVKCLKNRTLKCKLKNKLKEISDDSNGKEINICQGNMEVLPSEKRECLLITGPSGSGKSYFCGCYIRNFHKMFPESEIFVMSRLNQDVSLDNLGVELNRIELDDEFIENPISMEEFPDNCLVLYDDISSFEHTRKVLFDAIFNLQSQMLETGRHKNIYILVTNHMALNYKSTRMVLAESQKVCFFPHAGSTYGIKQYMKRYSGFDNKQINKFLNLPSRWAVLSNTFPNYVVHEKGVYLI